jgi:mono/diheme cytochrome c family protein
MNHRMAQIARAVLLLVVVLLAVTGSTQAQDAGALFKAKCSTCHAGDGSGTSSMGKTLGASDLHSDQVQKKTDSQLIDSITNGMGKNMPAYKGKLTDDQITGLVAYIRELAKKK